MLDPSDVLAIHNLLALYGHVIDERQWSRLGELFTEDVLYDSSPSGGRVLHGVDAVLKSWTGDSRHPLAHHLTSIIVSEDDDGTVRVVSKPMGVGYRGRVGSGTYHDVVQRTPDGWRIAVRLIKLRTPESIPPPS